MSNVRQKEGIKWNAERSDKKSFTPSLRSRIDPAEGRISPSTQDHRYRDGRESHAVGNERGDHDDQDMNYKRQTHKSYSRQAQNETPLVEIGTKRRNNYAQAASDANLDRHVDVRSEEERDRDYQRRDADRQIERQNYHENRRQQQEQNRSSAGGNRSPNRNSQPTRRYSPVRHMQTNMPTDPPWRDPQYRSGQRQQRDQPKDKPSLNHEKFSSDRFDSDRPMPRGPTSGHKRSFDDFAPPHLTSPRGDRSNPGFASQRFREHSVQSGLHDTDSGPERIYPSHSHNVRQSRAGTVGNTFENGGGRNQPFARTQRDSDDFPRDGHEYRAREEPRRSRNSSPVRRYVENRAIPERSPGRGRDLEGRRQRGNLRKSMTRSPSPRHSVDDFRGTMRSRSVRWSRSRSRSCGRSASSERRYSMGLRSPAAGGRRYRTDDNMLSHSPSAPFDSHRRRPLPNQSELLIGDGYDKKPLGSRHPGRGEINTNDSRRYDPDIRKKGVLIDPSFTRENRFAQRQGEDVGRSVNYVNRRERSEEARDYNSQRQGRQRDRSPRGERTEERQQEMRERNIRDDSIARRQLQFSANSVPSTRRLARDASTSPLEDSHAPTSGDRSPHPADALRKDSQDFPRPASAYSARAKNSFSGKNTGSIDLKVSSNAMRSGRSSSLLDTDRPDSSDSKHLIKRGPSEDQDLSPTKRAKIEQAQRQFDTPESISTPHSARMPKHSAAKKQSRAETPSKPTKDTTGVTPTNRAVASTADGSIYERMGQVGEGTYGKVYKARHRLTNEFVALKRIRMEQEKDGFPITSVREIKLLQRLKHPGIVQLLEMMIEKGSVYMVFEYMDHDLTGVLANPNVSFEARHIKDLASQLFEGLAYLHHRGVLHRDIKASNILLDNAGQLKLADFGLARFYQKSRLNADYTNRVITLWFRPPELLLGATAYDAAVDIWSAGCIFIELFTKATIFPGRDEIHQLETIYSIMGSPTTENWPSVATLPWFELIKFASFPPKFEATYTPQLPPDALALSLQILSLDPSRRPVAAEVLKHPYFTSALPKPERVNLSGIKESHEWDTKQRRRDERAKKAKDEKKQGQTIEVPVTA